MEPIRNHIIVQFDTELVNVTSSGRTRNQFKETTEWGFDLGGTEQEYDKSAKTPRWAVVTDIGPEVEGIEVGDHVLIDALKWTLGFETGGKKYWRTDVDCVLLIEDTTE